MMPPAPTPPGRSAAEARYRALNDIGFRATETNLAAAGMLVELRRIDPAALIAAEQWTGRRVHWPWRVLTGDWRRNHSSRFEVAVWRDGRLCGLALGRPAPSAAHVSLHYIERDPDPANPLRGDFAAVVVTALASYGVVLGKTEMRLVNPLPALVPYYCSAALGFALVTPAHGGPYCIRRI